ncbi:hypothetical protein ClosIBUN13A_CONTIG126g02007 [Clostridium sp. IBUN13A]|nr:hypothetical protein ClosIBUN22A_CONTIG65g01283 [Clostridium sp. IBUN22A]KJZ88362.1 hypothetical protein ClosIBUN125C_CONTIG23g01500 [Clostridium sp. IBUN125C]KJZ91406.1 hypothetical protein ClosIBUN62F_CONTIG72g02550 [Clostridium sp. IBUN62F]KJZ97202.1 hypothetical protein ClosIBUN13A_CONTIG126g02007 [Clostridium sp. IBUN13A]
MFGAYYSKAVDSKELFDKLNISSCDGYEENLNKYNVINISFNEIPDEMDTYEDYISNIQKDLSREIKKPSKRSALCGISIYDRSSSNKEIFKWISS